MWYFWWLIVLSVFPVFIRTVFNETNGQDDGAISVFMGIMGIWLVWHIIEDIIIKIKQKITKYRSSKVLTDQKLEKLEKLIILQLQGALTKEEFEEQKAKLMKKYK